MRNHVYIKRIWLFVRLILLVMIGMKANAQISPGELSSAHAHLKGIANCTKCHILGEKKTSSKCLECHIEIRNLQDAKKGYHSSGEVIGKKCALCHGDHFGREFNMIKLDENTFDHGLAGYELVGVHKELECTQCHKKELIHDNISQNTGFTYLGLGIECLSCHTDYHQQTLSSNCLSCHNQVAFSPASRFDHNKTDYPLQGKHTLVDCIKCHLKEERNSTTFQQFTNVAFSDCTDCHDDVHNNKFGNNCTKCHTVESFQEIKNINSFDHSQTNFPLKGKHLTVECKDCHPGSYTAVVEHDNCSDCHEDYHDKQFQKDGIYPDCDVCHSIDGFTPSFYTIEQHNQSDFKLDAAHMATPCFICHKPEDKWDFSIKGENCTDCHENIHKEYINEKYFQKGDCEKCHSLNCWTEISFNHNQTIFLLEGKHKELSCRECHFKVVNNQTIQQFSWEAQNCTNCHEDYHNGQFSENGIVNCESCHSVNNWEPTKFNHDNTRFKLDGEHINIPCEECHKPESVEKVKYRSYKFDDISCTSCHLQ